MGRSILIILFLLGISLSQQPEWVARYDGPGNDLDEARAIAVDNQGNVYITGRSYGSISYDDYATIKYNPSGQQIWVARYNGLGNDDDDAFAIAVDNDGNVYITGSGAPNDYVTIKYSSVGIEESKKDKERLRAKKTIFTELKKTKSSTQGFTIPWARLSQRA